MIPSLHFFMTIPPENIPRATAGMLIMPRQTTKYNKISGNNSYKQHQAATWLSKGDQSQNTHLYQSRLIQISCKVNTSHIMKDENDFWCVREYAMHSSSSNTLLTHSLMWIQRALLLHCFWFLQIDLIIGLIHLGAFLISACHFRVSNNCSKPSCHLK